MPSVLVEHEDGTSSLAHASTYLDSDHVRQLAERHGYPQHGVWPPV